MDITIDDHSYHLPAELADNIVKQLQHDVKSLANVRLVNKLLNSCAIPRLSTSRTPSELFVPPEHDSRNDGDTSSSFEPEAATKPLDDAVTIWTWITISSDVQLEESSTTEGRRLRELLWARKRANCSCSSQGSRGSCFGRPAESPDHLWLIQKWTSTISWNSYRSCNCAKELRDYFETVAPGSVQNSESEHIFLQGNISYERKSLFEGYYEARTYYFPASLSKKSRVAFEAGSHDQAPSAVPSGSNIYKQTPLVPLPGAG